MNTFLHTIPSCKTNLFFLQAKKTLLSLFFFLVSFFAKATTITSTSAGGSWNASTTWIQSGKSGLILASTFSPTVSGIGTAFLTQLSVGSIIYNGSIVGTVASIQSNTSLTLTSNAAQLISIGAGYTAQVVPSSTDDAVIASGATVNVTSNGNINSITFSNSGSSTSTLNVDMGNTLNIATGITLQNRATGNTAAIISGDGSIICASISIGNNTSPTTSSTAYTHQLTSTIFFLGVSGNISIISRTGANTTRIANGLFFVSDGTLSVDGNISTTNSNAVNSSTFSMTSGSQSGDLVLNASGPFNFSATGTNIISLNGSYSTVTYNSSVAQTIEAYNYHNLITAGTGTKTFSSSGTIGISGSFNPGANSIITGSTIDFNGSGTQYIPAFNFYNLTISNSITLNAADTVTNTLAFGGSNRTLTTSGFLTLKSSSAGTARLADITNAGTSSGNIISGVVTIESYIPANRGWRLLSAPISSTGAPTINAAWQEGLTTASSNPNLYPGYGVKIAGGTTTNGFDQSNTNSSFIKAYNNSTNSFVTLPSNPGTNVPITNYPAYLLYTRGDRSINLMQGLGAAITSATVRVKGQIKTGNQNVSVNATNYTLVGNPYPSAIDFGSLTKTNVANTMYIWDPKMAGDYGIGSYVTISWNTAAGNYDVTTSSSSVSRYIPSGEAFFVKSADQVNPGTIVIKETDKATSNNHVYRINGLNQRIITNLYLVNPDSSSSLLDGVITTFDDINSNSIDDEDAAKMINSGETIALNRDNILLSIERRKSITINDSIPLNISRMKIRSYRLEIISENLNVSGLIGFVKDNYSGVVNNTPIDMNGLTSISFSINTDPASYAANRFSIVFASLGPLPVTIKSIKAYKQQKNVRIEWTTENELNIKEYEVERSIDGRDFNKINTAAVKAMNGGNATYAFIDEHPVRGNNYYRIVSAEQNGKRNYSKIVNVAVMANDEKPSIAISANPVTTNNITIQFNNIIKGDYSLGLFNSGGQLIITKTIQHSESALTESINIDQKFSSGKYELMLTGKDLKLTTDIIKR